MMLRVILKEKDSVDTQTALVRNLEAAAMVSEGSLKSFVFFEGRKALQWSDARGGWVALSRWFRGDYVFESYRVEAVP